MRWLEQPARPNFFQLYTPDVISAQHKHVFDGKNADRAVPWPLALFVATFCNRTVPSSVTARSGVLGARDVIIVM
jgi:hypothetical protein